ncbi:MAG TPA: DUF4142 domain-containing protein [Thermoanaerobaculia bacterium]|jgi:putative membrane protein
MHRITITTLAALLLLAGACKNNESANATDTNTTETMASSETTGTTVTSPAGEVTPPPPANVNPGDREFVETAARTGMAEVQLATKVTQRAASADVRAFAQKMIDEHNASNQELTTLAAGKGIDPPADLDPEHKQLDTQLEKLTGAALDKAYMEAMVKDHTKAATAFEAATQTLADPDIKAWATKTLPVLHQHHQMAADILAKLK